jgi:hypothetical protein
MSLYGALSHFSEKQRECNRLASLQLVVEKIRDFSPEVAWCNSAKVVSNQESFSSIPDFPMPGTAN